MRLALAAAAAQILAQAGARIVVVDVNAEGTQETIAALGDGLAIACDLRDAAAVTAMHDQVMAEVGGVDILVNCAGIIAYRKGINAVDRR